MYSNKKESDFNTPFCTFNSGTRYSFISAGKTVKGEQVSATIAIATVVHTLKQKIMLFSGNVNIYYYFVGTKKDTLPVLSLLYFQVVEQGGQHIMRTNCFGNVTKCIYSCSSDGFFVSL